LAFRPFVEHRLLYALNSHNIVISGNLVSRKGKEVRARACISLCFLPFYAPDLSLLEQIFAKPNT